MNSGANARLFSYAYTGRMDEVIQALDMDKSVITALDSSERMLIHWAALGGHAALVRYLFSCSSPVDPQDDMHMTPLILASSGGRLEVVRLLLSLGANINAQNVQGHSALQYAASKGWKEIVRVLLEGGADVNVADIRGARPLHRASSIGHLPVVNLLLSRNNVEIDARDAQGNTSLHLSCEEDRGEVAVLLVQRGAQLDALNKEKKTPLDYASVELAKMLTSTTQQV